MEQSLASVWERIAGWLVGLLLVLGGWFMEYWRRCMMDEINELKSKNGEHEKLCLGHVKTMAAQETRVQVINAHVEAVEKTLDEIKSSLHYNTNKIDTISTQFNEKLDRLLSRPSVR